MEAGPPTLPPPLSRKAACAVRAAGEGEEPVPINVEGMWPYWKEPESRGTGTVHNDLVDMHAMYLLTGAHGPCSPPTPPLSTWAP